MTDREKLIEARTAIMRRAQDENVRLATENKDFQRLINDYGIKMESLTERLRIMEGRCVKTANHRRAIQCSHP